MAHNTHNRSRGQGRRTMTNLRPIKTTIVKALSQKPKGGRKNKRKREGGRKRKEDRGRREPDWLV